MDNKEKYSWMITEFINEVERMIQLIRKQGIKLRNETGQMAGTSSGG